LARAPAPMAFRIHGKYLLGRKIGHGSFGDVHLGTHIETGEELAIKLEPANTRNPGLIYEAKLYKILAGSTGIPRIHWYGLEGECNVLVMDLLGPSLEDLLGSCGGSFSLKTVLALADQMIERAELLHSKSYIHRDIKPDNFLVGLGDKAGLVYMIDFGCAKKYRDPQTLRHIPFRDGKDLMGTARYASINAHLGREQSRRDDLEAIGYVLVYLSRGHLPWQGLKAASLIEKLMRIPEVKRSTALEVLCEGLPDELPAYMRYCGGLGFEDEPDYAHLRGLLRGCFSREGYQHDLVFDWTPPEEPPKADTPRSGGKAKPEKRGLKSSSCTSSLVQL